MPRLYVVFFHFFFGAADVAEEAFASGGVAKFVDEAAGIFAAYVKNFEGVVNHR